MTHMDVMCDGNGECFQLAAEVTRLTETLAQRERELENVNRNYEIIDMNWQNCIVERDAHAGALTTLREALAKLLAVTEAEGVPGYIYTDTHTDTRAECGDCDGHAATRADVKHDEGCYQAAYEAARAALAASASPPLEEQ